MAGVAAVNPRFQFIDANGNPVALGTCTVYLAGTVTPTNTWQDRDQDTLNTNPVDLDAAGGCTMWLDSSLYYKFLVKNAAGATVTGYPVDNISGAAANSENVTFIQAGTDAYERSAQDKMRESVSILDFIPVAEHADIAAGTSTYDCFDALTNAMASQLLNTGTYNSAGPSVFFPLGIYKINETVHLKTQVHLFGVNGGLPDGQPSQIVFPADVPGFVVHAYNTDETGTVTPRTRGGDGTIFENLTLVGGGGSDATTHGVWMRARANIKNCTVRAWEGNGVHILATAGGGGFTEGNSNLWRIDTLYTASNGGHGVFVDGADVNAGCGIAINASGNGGWGIYDSSFLGNTYIGCHTDANTLGPYKSDGGNAKNVFLGCYSESGQPESDLTYPAMLISGLHGAGFTGTFVNMNEYPTRILGESEGPLGETLQYQAGAVDVADGVAQYFTSSDDFPFRLHYIKGYWYWNWANSSYHFFRFYNTQATIANGFARTLTNGEIGFSRFFLGETTQMKRQDTGGGAPGAGEGNFLVGDIRWNGGAFAGGTAGWICTTAGVAGSTAVFKTFGAIAP